MKRFRKFFRTVATLLMVIIIIAVGHSMVIRYLHPKDFSDHIEKYSSEYKVPKELVFAVVKCESSFDPNAKSNKDAVGLMQLTEETFNDVKKMLGDDDDLSFSKNATDEEINIKYGTYYLKFLSDYFEGDETAAIAAYNAGLGNVQKWIGEDKKLTVDEIKFAETKEYVKRVLKAKKIYIKAYEKG